MHLAVISGMMKFPYQIFPEQPRDADQDNPQSDREVQVLCIRQGTAGRGGRQGCTPGGFSCTSQRKANMLWLQCSLHRLRYPSPSALRVCSALGLCGFLHLRDEEGRLPKMRRDSGESPVGVWQGEDNDDVCLVSGTLGQAAVLDRGSTYFPDKLGHRLSVCIDRSLLGAGLPKGR